MDWLLEQLTEYGIPVGLKLVAALLVLVVGLKLSGFLVRQIKKGRGFKHLDESVASFLASFLSILLKTMVVITAITIMGVPMSSIVALVASAGVAIGLAVQGALSNFVGGIMILMFKPFRKDDYIETEGISGIVRDITVFYTVLRTYDNRIITIPNGKLTNSVVTNLTEEKLRRVDLEFTADYASDIDSVKALLLAAAAECDKVLDNPAPAAVLVGHGENALQYALRAWCNKDDYWDVRSALLESVRKSFRENGINIPYAQMDVHIKKD